MSATILDSRAVAARKCEELAQQIKDFVALTGVTPGLVVVSVGDDPAIYDYIRVVTKKARDVGIDAIAHVLSENLTQQETSDHLVSLNADPKVHAISLQVPLPPHLVLDEAICVIRPDKDVEGCHPANARVVSRRAVTLIPTPALGALQLLDAYGIDPSGLQVVVLGRNGIIGKPLAMLLSEAGAHVTVAHRGTTDIVGLISSADLLVLGASIPGGVASRILKPGVVIVDFGINYADDENETLTGNLNFDEAVLIAGAITPMPGGTGPMTTMSLLQNTLKAARLQTA